MKKLLMLFALVCSGSALAQSPSDTEQYHYGMHLDVAQVISISEPQDKCHPSPVTMIYRDSHGNVKSLKYLVAGTDCGNAND
jgi:hypothetical protein